ncbi:urea ABC transporter substrate-binding protein [Natronolimnobius baerhuensis]|uniref:Urea ABC transporter substrate-binding protein n=1 Tax=Natronolimnobius baerhuensis TaxID=253108 RepID=A0A202E4V4_9EURY|nr:urea ABC transporter substrate-binding protein [Natronolimnobius baerhuensis]OVE83323.1 urea ABC transporter substrate-binding protein [Natronolimnobius baerhuensis]
MSRRSLSRRDILAAGTAGTAIGLSGCLSDGGVLGGSDDEDGAPTIGILEDRSGEFALNGESKWQASLLAVEELNANGGVLGEEIEVYDPDPQSDNQRYQELTREAINSENVDALWAGYSSATREAIRPIINDEEQLYFYTTQYEGGVCDSTTFAMGATARQQLGAVIPYMIEEYGPRIYTIAADYNFGQISGDWVRILAEEHGAEVVGEEYIPLGETDFGSTINNIQGEDPDFIASMLVGDSHANFYEQRADTGLDIPMGSSTTMAQGYEHLRLDPPALEDMYVGVNYMEELETEESQTFVDAFYEEYPDADYLNQEAQNNYFSIHMWADAVEAAGTFDQEAVIAELESGMEIDAPEGTIELDPATHHMTHHMRIGHADENHEVTFDEEQYIEPTFLHEVGCDLTEEAEQTQYEPEEFYDLI